MFEDHSFTPVDEAGIHGQIARMLSRDFAGEAKVPALKMALGMIDLTTLEGSDTPLKVRQVCDQARNIPNRFSGLPSVAAVCVYPTLVSTAKAALKGSPVRVAAVSTYFPSGQATHELKMAEVRYALDEGADEIDMVISRNHFLQGNYQAVYEEIMAVKEICYGVGARLKVILETGEIGSLDEVRKASEIALMANPDFIKTSTGKIIPAANMPVTLVMLQAIADHYHKTGHKTGMKPAGGISTAEVALQYLVMVKETLGPEWLSPTWFRFGASRLLDDVLRQLEKQPIN